jgi:hypothetical protein
MDIGLSIINQRTVDQHLMGTEVHNVNIHLQGTQHPLKQQMD